MINWLANVFATESGEMMGLRFRRSVGVFPGVRLNLSRSGISTTIGVRGASFTAGSRGSHVNIGLPGTGLSIHQRIDAGSKRPTISTKSPPLLSHPDEIPALPTSEKTPPLIGEIRSADNAAITSLGFVELKNLLSRAYDELKRLQSETPGIDAELLRTKDRAYKWTNGILLKHLLKKQYQRLQGI